MLALLVVIGTDTVVRGVNSILAALLVNDLPLNPISRLPSPRLLRREATTAPTSLSSSVFALHVALLVLSLSCREHCEDALLAAGVPLHIRF